MSCLLFVMEGVPIFRFANGDHADQLADITTTIAGYTSQVYQRPSTLLGKSPSRSSSFQNLAGRMT